MNFLFFYNFILSKDTQHKLSRDIIPLTYDLEFDISPEKFTGVTVITIESASYTNHILLNSKSLEIQTVSVEEDNNLLNTTFSTEEEKIKIFTEKQLEKDKIYKILIKYQGKYSKELDGIYKSSYNGKPLYSTQFEPTSARKAFPCFDQPDLKAIFNIKITAPENHTVLSNSSLNKKEGNTYIFNATKPMSTYLVAFAIGQLDYIQTSTDTNIPIRVYADKKDIKNGRLALEIAKHTLTFFQRYFQIDYPFPKLDLIAIPEYAMGAMENWGLVTFRKTSLLYNSKTDSVASKLNVIETVCHELAHMWFGNLVTMNWWNDLWLNEGFATWASFMAVYNLPENIIDFDIWTNFINTTLEEGMEYDSLSSTHPIAVEVKDPAEINQIFDKISYNKGASIIRMIENFIGHDFFRKGIQRYMNNFKYSNSESNDFFMFQNNPVLTTKMAHSWLNQKGYPLISVEEKDKKLVLSQKRFLMGKKTNENKTWIIPVTIQFKNNNPKTFIFDQQTLQIPLVNDIYKLNIGNVGVYRVLYDKKTFERIFTNFDSVKDRLNIINDLFALAFSNYVDMKWVVSFLTSQSFKYDYELLKSILSGLRKLCLIYHEETEQITMLQNAIKKLLAFYIADVDLEKNSKDISTKLLNNLVVSNAIFVNDLAIKTRLKNMFVSFRTGDKQICPDYIFPMLVSVVDEYLDDVINIAKNSILSNMRIMALKALGAVKNQENIQKVLNLYSELDRQDISYYFLGLGGNTAYQSIIINFFIDNYDKISDYIVNQSIINSSMLHLLSGITDSNLITKISKFLNKFKENLTVRNIQEINEIYKNYKEKNPTIF